MITENYCSFELSKLLKEKGFDEKCPSYYRVQDSKIDLLWNHFEGKLISNSELNQYFVSAPTHQMAMKWLREVHNIIIVIEPHSYNYMEEKTSSYDFSIWCGDNYEHPFTTNYPTYEETVEAALKYCLINLIEK